MTDQPAVLPVTPGVRVEFTWAATDGSAPESASVWWEHVIPPPEEICQVIAALAQSAGRYELAADPEPGEQILSPLDICERETCRDARQVHPRNGACTLCAESIPCASFLEIAPATRGYTIGGVPMKAGVTYRAGEGGRWYEVADDGTETEVSRDAM